MELINPKDFPQAKHLGDFEPDSMEWHSVRDTGIGGSEIGTILGLNPWESAYALWAKKLKLISSDIASNWPIRLGKALEEPILELFAEEHPELKLYRAGSFVSNATPFLHANCDAIAYDEKTGEWIVIEVKTARSYWPEIPPHYVAQVQHYMYVMGIKRSVVVALAGMDYKEYWIDADEFQQQVQVDAATRFWDKFLNQEKPDWDGSESTYQAVRSMHPMIDDEEVDLGDLGIHLTNAQTKVDEAQKELNMLKSMVMDAMGYAKTGYVELDSGERIRLASRQIRGGTPALIIHRGK